MITPAHVGLEHPNLTWLVTVGLIAFVSGLGANLYRSTVETESNHEPNASDEYLE